MLDGTLESPEERARAARVIDSESRRLLHLVGELLDLSRIESGQQRMAAAAVDVSELFAHVADVFSLRSEETSVTLNVDTAAGVTVLADFDRIEQVLGNLIDNAFRHTQAGGRIEVSAQVTAGMAEITVADDGEGIATQDLPHVFDRFYRSSLAAPDAAGSGLGLAIAREIVRAHGGVIRAEARDGGGTRFAFTLPLAPAAPSPLERNAPPSLPNDVAPAET
jgi:signal transduction histidine kinase